MPYYRRNYWRRDFVPYQRYHQYRRKKAQPRPVPTLAPPAPKEQCLPSPRILDENVLASSMKCSSCNVALCFVEKENQRGSDLQVRCHQCSSVNLVATDNEHRGKLGPLKLVNINTTSVIGTLSGGAETNSQPVFHCVNNMDDEEDPFSKIVFYDLETSGLARNCDILHISARCGNSTFESYIHPVQKIEPAATKVHHLIDVNGLLYQHGQLLQSVPLKDALDKFHQFLSRLGGPCLLVAHNGTDFDSVRLVFAIKCCNLVREFGKVVNGFADTLPLFWRKLNRSVNCSQTHLAAEFLKITDTSAKDVETLQKLCAHFEFDEGHFMDSRNYLTYTNRVISINLVDSLNSSAPGGVNEIKELNTSLASRSQNIINEPSVLRNMNNIIDIHKSSTSSASSFDSPNIVFYDLETSGLGKTCDILQLAARCGNSSFQSFINPVKKIALAATKVNHMTNVNGQLYRHGELLPSVPLKDALENFLKFLSGLSGLCLLVAHNGLEFDSVRLMYSIKRCRLIEEFRKVISGFADTLPLFQNRLNRFNRCSQTFLAAEFLQIPDNDAHDAVNDVEVLEKLCTHFKFQKSHFMGSLNYVPYADRT